MTIENNHNEPSCSLHPNFLAQNVLTFTNNGNSTQFLQVYSHGTLLFNANLTPGETTPEFTLDGDNVIHWANDSYSVVDYGQLNWCAPTPETTTTTGLTSVTVPTSTTMLPAIVVPSTEAPTLVALPAVGVGITESSVISPPNAIKLDCVWDASVSRFRNANGEFQASSECSGVQHALANTGATTDVFMLVVFVLIALGILTLTVGRFLNRKFTR